MGHNDKAMQLARLLGDVVRVGNTCSLFRYVARRWLDHQYDVFHRQQSSLLDHLDKHRQDHLVYERRSCLCLQRIHIGQRKIHQSICLDSSE